MKLPETEAAPVSEIDPRLEWVESNAEAEREYQGEIRGAWYFNSFAMEMRNRVLEKQPRDQDSTFLAAAFLALPEALTKKENR